MKEEFVKEMDRLEDIITEKEIKRKKAWDIGIDLINYSDYQLENMVINLLSYKYGIFNSSIEWFIYENKFGKKGLACSQNGKRVAVTSAEIFYDFEKGV